MLGPSSQYLPPTPLHTMSSSPYSLLSTCYLLPLHFTISTPISPSFHTLSPALQRPFYPPIPFPLSLSWFPLNSTPYLPLLPPPLHSTPYLFLSTLSLPSPLRTLSPYPLPPTLYLPLLPPPLYNLSTTSPPFPIPYSLPSTLYPPPTSTPLHYLHPPLHSTPHTLPSTPYLPKEVKYVRS